MASGEINGRLTQLLADIDDWCGTGRKPGFPPRPHQLKDLLISVAIGTLAAEITDQKVREGIQGQAASLYNSSAKQIAG